MTITTTSSISHQPAPLSWVESLFVRLQGMYGNKFLDMWRDTDIGMVKALWAEEMGKLTNKELKRGVGALIMREWPPSLPEFVNLCKTLDGPQRVDVLALPEPRSPNAGMRAAEMLENLGASGIAKDYESRIDHKLWAKKIMERESRGDKTLSCLQVNFAREALRATT